MTEYTKAGGSPVLDPAHSTNQDEPLCLTGAVDMPTVDGCMGWNMDGRIMSPTYGTSDHDPTKEVIHVKTEVHDEGCPCS
jgi:hypothetical protein